MVTIYLLMKSMFDKYRKNLLSQGEEGVRVLG